MMSVALLDPTTLTGQELRDGLAQRPELAPRVELLATHAEDGGALIESGGEPALVRQIEVDDLRGIDLVFACGSMAATREALAQADAGSTIILLCPDADVDDGIPVVAGVNDASIRRGETLLSPAPTVIAVAHVMNAVHDLEPSEAIATAIQPASTHGSAGLDQLLEQTRKLLTFQRHDEPSLFGGQMAFNVLPVASTPQLTAQLAAVIRRPQNLALTVLQGSVFHSLSVSLYVRFAADPGLEAVRQALDDAAAIELVEEASTLGPIDAAAREQVLIGDVLPNAGPAGGYWIWAAMDNLTRGGALNALEIAERLQQS
jgi:aspartate-semialdehyde dehydrogenase